MKKENGFTLVELMGILVILGILLIVTVPTITKTLKNSQNNEKKEYENTICAAAKTYLSIEKESYDDFWNRTTGTSISATVNIQNDLKDEGYIADNLKNPTSYTKVKVTRYISTDKNMDCVLTN